MNKRPSFHIKKGDTVMVITGRDKGAVGEILSVLTRSKQVLIKGVNLKKKHLKSTSSENAIRTSTLEFPVHISNVMLYSSTARIASRTSVRFAPNGTKVRVLKKLPNLS